MKFLRLGFLARHSLALAITVGGACVVWTVVYLALLLWGAVSRGDLGSPATYPIGLVLVPVAGAAVAVSVFLPITTLAEWLARRRSLPAIAQLPIAVFVLGLVCLAIVALGGSVAQPSLRAITTRFAILFFAHLVPLTVYWSVAEGAQLVLTSIQRLRGTVR